MLLRLLVLVLLSALSLRAEVVLHEKAAPLPFMQQGPFVRLGDGSILTMDTRGALVSRNEGRTWTARAIFDPLRFEPSGERALLRTREGVVLFAFLNLREKRFLWDDEKGGPQEGCRIPVYLLRSSDDGLTWEAPVLLQDGWCGAVRQFLRLRNGRILLVAQKAMANPGRHVTIVYHSDDLGQNWHAGDGIDLGEAGNYRDPVSGLRATTHGGGLEGTVLERADGVVRLLLRVPHGCFYEANSRDGVKWSVPQPAPIEASDSPGTLVRLASGRVALVWNRFRDPVKRLGRREQLSIAFSENDGVTWTAPQVFAVQPTPAGQRESAYWIAYPYVFEAEPGRLWISTMQGRLCAALHEADFLGSVGNPLDGPAVRVLALGDSITRGARPGVLPTETFSARVQAALREAGAKVLVHNLGIGGERTDQALRRLDRDVLAQRPHLVLVMYGTNDGWVDEGQTASRLGEESYEANLREIVGRLRAAGIVPVLMTPPRFGEENRRNGLGEDPNERLARYAGRCRNVARETGVPLVDHFAAWTEAQEQGQSLQGRTTDGCHPNGNGHADLAGRILPVVAPLVRQLLPSP